MQDIVLLLSAAAIFAFGWFLMGKLDGVLKQGQLFQEPAESLGEKRLWLGFFDPLAADSLSPALEGFEKKYPNVAVCLSCGAAGELLDGIVSGKLDAVFLPKDIVFPEKSRYHTKIVTVDCTSVTMRYGGAAIAPITPGRMRQMMVWPKERSDFLVSAFAACLTNRLGTEAAKPKSMIS